MNERQCPRTWSHSILFSGGHRQSLGDIPPGPMGQAGDGSVGASYQGDPDPMVDVGLGVEGGILHSSYHCWVAVIWMVGGD